MRAVPTRLRRPRFWGHVGTAPQTNFCSDEHRVGAFANPTVDSIMSESETKTRPNSLYESDFFTWTQEQARLLRERRFDDLDLDNLVDEVESVGSSEKREIRSRLVILIGHLLKWKFQPGGRGSS
jgi:hypothetical protein